MEQETIEEDAKDAETDSSDLYRRYLEDGGKLIEIDYNAAKASLKNKSENTRAGGDSVTIVQVRGMAERNGIKLSPEMIRMYCALRDRTGADYPNDTISVNDGVRRVLGMSDQELFAEVLRLAGRDREYEIFVGKYPNIFSQQ